MMRSTFWAGAAIVAAFAAATLASAQRWGSDDRYDQRGSSQQRNVPGEFDYYALVLSWSPTYCSESGERDETQCNRRDGRRYAFVLHGLWPQHTRGWPDSCRLPRRPFVPENLISEMLDIMPSRNLIIHEYRKHGTCSGLDPARYYQLSRKLFQSVRIPDEYRNPFETQFTSPAELVREFSRANPQIPRDAIAVACNRSGGRLKEVRICFSKDGRPTACGDNENARRLCSTERVFVPPVRSTARDDNVRTIPAPAPYNPRAPLPGTRSQEAPRGL